jgi:glycosyltransferase involved in cell wall biosynthesis
MPKLKVMHVIPYIKLGGAENVVKILSSHLIKNENQVSIMAFSSLNECVLETFKQKNINLILLNQIALIRFLPKNLSSLIWLIFNIKKIKTYHVIHCHLTFGSIFAFYIFILKKISFSSFPVIVQTNHSVGSPISAIKQRIYYYLFSFSDGLALISMDKSWRENRKQKFTPLVTEIKNGVSVNAKKILNLKQIKDFKERLSINNNENQIVGTLGRLDKDRDPERFLQVFNSVAKKNKNIHFIVCGDGQCKEDLKEYSKINHFFNRIHFLNATLETEEIFSLCDYYLTANVESMTGLTGIESALCKTPVIAIQWQQDYEGRDDWIWSSTEIEEIALKICKDLSNREYLERLSDNQYHYAVQNLTAEAMSKKYLSFYEALLKI